MLNNPTFVKEAVDHLTKCKFLAPIIESQPIPEYSITTDPFYFLTRAIVFQQLSGKAASTIFARFESKIKNIQPNTVLTFTIEELRSVGISRPKATYILDLATKIEQSQIHPEKWFELSEPELRKELTSVKGLGEWSADMFLIFALCKPDIWPVTDQGIRNAAKLLTSSETHLTPEKLNAIADQFRPYRSVAAHYFWRAVDVRTTQK